VITPSIERKNRGAFARNLHKSVAGFSAHIFAGLRAPKTGRSQRFKLKQVSSDIAP
jgi:hypothetical protein